MLELKVYVSDDCWSCEETHRIVAAVRPQFPDITFTLLNTGDTPLPEAIFAVPSYVLNGRIIYLGNPTRTELCAKLLKAQYFNSPA